MKDKKTRLVYSTDEKTKQQIEENKNTSKDRIDNLPPSEQSLQVMIQTKGRRGKVVTVVKGFRHDAETLRALARTLKQQCGAGGTVKDQCIEIQGDKRKQVAEKLKSSGYQVRLS